MTWKLDHSTQNFIAVLFYVYHIFWILVLFFNVILQSQNPWKWLWFTYILEVWYDIISYDMISCLMIWYHILWYDIISYLIISYRKIWYHIIRCDIILYFKNVCEPQPFSRILTFKMFEKKSTEMSFYEGIGSRFEQMKKSKNETETFSISSRSGRTDISKYNVLG